VLALPMTRVKQTDENFRDISYSKYQKTYKLQIWGVGSGGQSYSYKVTPLRN
jgi:hypothetical protein